VSLHFFFISIKGITFLNVELKLIKGGEYMSRVSDLILEGIEIKNTLAKETSSEFDKWISESLLYVEKNYPKTDFANFFIADVESFRQQWISFEIIDKETFGRLISHLDAISSDENASLKEREERNARDMAAINKMR
jgi:hypothetical protein